LPEKALHVPDVHALFEEVGGDRMAKHVRRYATGIGGVLAELSDESADIGGDLQAVTCSDRLV
jgi:hypothetical protein